MTSMCSSVCDCRWIWALRFIDQLLLYIAPIFYQYFTVSLQCVCSPGWIGEFCQYVGDACLMKPNVCLNGKCVTISQPTSSPEYACNCPLGFTGEIFLIRFLFSSLCFYLSVCLQYASKYGSLCCNTPLWEGCSWGKKWQIDIWRKSDMVAL